MWPGQQPPGGEQNPQHQNPYQQPNPYQQTGHQQPNPYQQPTQSQWGAPPPVGAPQPPRGGGNRTKAIAIGAATVVVVAAGVTGFLVLGGNKDDHAGGDKPTSSASASQSPTASASGSGDDPRGAGGDAGGEKPTIPGWKVTVNPKRGIAFDVPADWTVGSPTSAFGFADNKTGNPVAYMAGVAEYKPKWCTSDDDKDGRTEDTDLAAAGSKGAGGAKNTDEVAVNTVGWWVYAPYTQPDKKSFTVDAKAQPYKTASGVQGSIAWARSSHTPQKGKCATDGKALAFGFKNAAGDFVSWIFFGAKGVPDEVPKATIMKILSTVRLHGTPTGS
ncbi:hypothetical protein [Streptomyces alanosinicus]|uniref:DUF8017 domain-containing protein n=1 Tax=Streptomyces alanosinicus TaxID=68171 RepID=A0A918YD63_9ACTN|nr:hypothetical protein [Streptomyces alanosinicus]GHD99610.1 hypothetical protein GCM10010339_11610 [Streptomyces alanosinicus]